MEQTEDRRLSPRLLCAELVAASWQDARGREMHRVANLEDISASGMCLQLETPVETGTPICVQHGTEAVKGLVVYSFWRDGATFLGIEADEDCKPALARLRPGHLVDPRQMLLSVLLRHGIKDVSGLRG